jgi:hypothetical protein
MILIVDKFKISEIIENAVVVTVRIYRPIKNSPRQPVSSFRYVQEIVLLGKWEKSNLMFFWVSEKNRTLPRSIFNLLDPAN